MTSHTHVVQFGGSGGGPASVYPQPEIDLGQSQVWNDAPEALADVTLDFGVGSATFHADWSEVITYLRSDYDGWSDIAPQIEHVQYQQSASPTKDDLPAPPKLPVEVSGSKTTMNHSHHLVKQYLYTVFLAANLSAPGCAEFWDVTIFRESNNHHDTLFLSSEPLAAAWSSALEAGWPPLSALPLSRSVRWFQSHQIGLRQIASYPIERALYALLYACHGNPPGPTEIIWLTHALEALTNSPVERIAKLLQDRLFLLLGKPEHNKKAVHRRLSDFYNLRSRIVHGDFNIAHPARNDLLERAVIDQYNDFFRHEDFAFSVILSLFQELIRNDWKGVEFSESVSGLR